MAVPKLPRAPSNLGTPLVAAEEIFRSERFCENFHFRFNQSPLAFTLKTLFIFQYIDKLRVLFNLQM